MINDHGKLVLVVDTDQRFIDDARPLLAGHRVVAARDVEEATEIVLGGRVDLVLLGPAFGSDIAISQTRMLIDADSSLQIALAADVVTNRLLKAALKGGFMDVLDIPISARDLDDMLRNLTPRQLQPSELTFVVEPAPSVPERATEDVAPDSEIQAVAPMPDAQTPEQVPAEPVSESTPAEVSFVTEPAEVSRPLAPRVAPYVDIPPAWPAEEASAAEVQPSGSSEPLPIATAPPVVPEDDEQFAPTPLPISEVLDQVLPPPPSPPPTVPLKVPVTPTPAPVPRSVPGRVIAVMAGKGGSGKTVTVTNLAVAMGLRTDPASVAIVDADLQFGDVALMLHIDPKRTLADLITDVETLSDTRIDAAMLRHQSGIRVLPAPVFPLGTGGISAKSVVEVVNRLRSMFDTIIVDTGPVFDDFLITVLENADDVIVVVDMDMPSVKNAKVALDGLRQIGFDMGRIRLVINRANSKANLDLAEVERTLGLRIGGSIPSDRLVPQAVNEGAPAITLSPRSKVARAFHALAESLDPTAHRDRIPDR